MKAKAKAKVRQAIKIKNKAHSWVKKPEHNHL